MEYIAPPPTTGYVLCADCGTPIQPNSANLCLSCLRNSIDITEGIPKQATVNFCRNCERYLNPPLQWVQAQLESRELLAICLKKLKGLNKVRLIDAGFIWTEPHSKRLRVKLTVQKEVRRQQINPSPAPQLLTQISSHSHRSSQPLSYSKSLRSNTSYNTVNAQIAPD